MLKEAGPGELELSLLCSFWSKGGQYFAVHVKDLNTQNLVDGFKFEFQVIPEVCGCLSRRRWHGLCCWRQYNADAQAGQACCPSSQTWRQKCRRFGKPAEGKSHPWPDASPCQGRVLVKDNAQSMIKGWDVSEKDKDLNPVVFFVADIDESQWIGAYAPGIVELPVITSLEAYCLKYCHCFIFHQYSYLQYGSEVSSVTWLPKVLRKWPLGSKIWIRWLYLGDPVLNPCFDQNWNITDMMVVHLSAMMNCPILLTATPARQSNSPSPLP